MRSTVAPLLKNAHSRRTTTREPATWGLPPSTFLSTRTCGCGTRTTGRVKGSGQAFRRRHHVLGRHAELLHDGATRRGETKSVDTERDPIEPHVLGPTVADGGLDRDALAARLRQHLFSIRFRLTIEARKARD